ncbi:hypothetical protein I79_021913 [Cricetulus griseus]|uniref:Uncharacterized protein n=1 Tax=Cricetulus griseus TaxID=10029 RepID=G3IDX5_CRIGR|nr:hypothetical protein I79_021913 [Cricetulus griseus]
MSLTQKDEWAGSAENHMGVFPQGGSLQAEERWTDYSLHQGGGCPLLPPLPFQVFKVKEQSQFGFTCIVL